MLHSSSRGRHGLKLYHCYHGLLSNVIINDYYCYISKKDSIQSGVLSASYDRISKRLEDSLVALMLFDYTCKAF